MRLKSTSSGSAALELVALITILLMPVGPMLALFSAVSDALAAESIARHGLRYAFLESGLGADPSGGIAPALQILAQSWVRRSNLIHSNVRLAKRVGISSWKFEWAACRPCRVRESNLGRGAR